MSDTCTWCGDVSAIKPHWSGLLMCDICQAVYGFEGYDQRTDPPLEMPHTHRLNRSADGHRLTYRPQTHLPALDGILFLISLYVFGYAVYGLIVAEVQWTLWQLALVGGISLIVAYFKAINLCNRYHFEVRDGWLKVHNRPIPAPSGGTFALAEAGPVYLRIAIWNRGHFIYGLYCVVGGRKRCLARFPAKSSAEALGFCHALQTLMDRGRDENPESETDKHRGKNTQPG